MKIRWYHKAMYWTSLSIVVFGVGVVITPLLTLLDMPWQFGLLTAAGGLIWLISISHLIVRILEGNLIERIREGK